MSDRLSTEELELMTDEERAGYEADIADDNDDDLDNGNLGDGDDNEENAGTDDQDNDSEGDELEENAGSDDEDEDDDDTGQDAGGVDSGDNSAGSDEVTYPEVTPLLDSGSIQSEIDAQYATKREIAQKFDDGDITAGEKAEKEIEIDRALSQLNRSLGKAQDSYDNAHQKWTGAHVPDFMKENPRYANNKTLVGLLDARVRELQTGHFSGNPFHPDILKFAHKAILKDLGLKDTPATQSGQNGQQRSRSNKRPDMPPSIASLPASELDDAAGDGGEFAYLDRLEKADPLAYEDALSKMTDAQLDRYSKYA